jgi:hypothetical protein
MFASIKIEYPDGTKSIIKVNPHFVSDFQFYNPKNVDDGTIIKMKNGDEIFTQEPLDIIDIKLEAAGIRIASAAYVHLISEFAKVTKTPAKRKPATRKTTVKK